MIKTVIFVLIALVLIIFLKEYRSEFAVILAAVVGAVILIVTVIEIYKPIESLFSVLEENGVNSAFTEYLLKTVGICYITGFSSDLCSDFGQTSLANKVELAGRAAIFILSLPIIENVLNMGLSLI